ncbi:MAG: caspase family protein, partial [Bryobacterales bacterium]|nr:caspase family protein [Bryobacterales bacterium]
MMRVLWALVTMAGLANGQDSRDLRYESGNGRRLALVVGNEAYPKWPLRNPVNDARAVEQALRELGFETESVVNAGLKALEQSVDRFVAKMKAGDVGMFYYAGHGIQIDGENYLVPVDFDAKDEADAKYVSYSASRVQERMDRAGARLT